jgi:hypothetical protein
VQSKLDVFLGISPKSKSPSQLPLSPVPTPEKPVSVQVVLTPTLAPVAIKVALPPLPPAAPIVITTPVSETKEPAPIMLTTTPTPTELYPAPDPSQDSEEVARFRRMLKVGIHPQAVRNKMAAEGLDPSLLFGSPTNMSSAPKKPVFLVLPITPLEKLSGLSFWRNNTTAKIDPELARALQVLQNPKPKFKKQPKLAKEDENQPPSSTLSRLPARRAQNIQIGLAKLKRSGEVLCAALLSFDDKALSLDDLQVLDTVLPSAEEMKKASTSSSNPADVFVATVSKYMFWIKHDFSTDRYFEDL